MTSPAPTPSPASRPTPQPARPPAARPVRPPVRRIERTTPVDAHPVAPTAAEPRTVTPGTVTWLVVLAAVAVVQLDRHAWSDSTVLFAVLAVLLVDRSGRLPHGSVAVAGTGPVVIGAAVLAGAVLFLAPRHGAVAGFTVAAVGAGALAYAWPDRADDEPGALDRPVWDRPTSRTAAAWSAAWIAGCLWELAMFLLGGTETDGRDVYPAASDLLDPLLANPLTKALFVVVWLTAGVGLIARTDRR